MQNVTNQKNYDKSFHYTLDNKQIKKTWKQ